MLNVSITKFGLIAALALVLSACSNAIRDDQQLVCVDEKGYESFRSPAVDYTSQEGGSWLLVSRDMRSYRTEAFYRQLPGHFCKPIRIPGAK